MSKTKTQENAMQYAENYLDHLLRRHHTSRDTKFEVPKAKNKQDDTERKSEK